ncbi:MAG: arylsulfatase [Planctomycetota bacterium]
MINMVKPSHFLIRILVVWFYCVLVAQPNESCQIFAEEPAAQPNVVIVITDDQGYGDLACLGNPILKTPNIDSLFHQSIRLTDYHVAPTCSPTRSALQSGHWTNRTGVWHTIMGRCMLRQNEPTIGQVFQNSGYATAMFGKWHLGDNYPYRPEDRGYNEVLRHGGGGVGQTPDYWDNAYFDGTYWHNGKPTPVKGYCTDVFFDYAKRFIKTQKNAGKPFLAYISTNAPHGPLHAPEEFAKPYYDVEIPNQNKKNQTSNSTPSAAQLRLAHFYGMIANIDSNVGQLRKFLEDESLAENTIFIFTTDNGTAGGRAIYNAGMRGQKGSQYDGGHRVPFFIHWPNGQLSGGKDVKPICHAVDVLPTLINLCNVASPEDVVFDGKDISSLLRGNPSKDIDWNNRILITDSQRVKDPIMWKSSSVMTSKWRLIDGKELYDMDTDPGQKVDVAAAYPAVVRRLRDFYQGWWEELEPTFNQDTAIYLGHPAENPARLTSHDWITTGSTPWNQMQIRLGLDKPQVTGFWNVNVAKAGTYQIRLRRWPKELDRAINAGLEKGDPVPGTKAFRMTPGREFQNLQSASVEISDKKVETTFESDAKEAILTMELPAGKTKLTARFHGPDGYTVGAYYAYVELVEQAEN